MNQRILELAEQAGLGQERWNTTEQFNSFLAKFAELIVKECIDINQQELSFNAFEQLMNRYQKQFGVEL